MYLMRTTKRSFNRRALATQAMQAAIATRAKTKLDQHGPICIYGLCVTLGVTVRFNNINMEGVYQRGAPPRIHLSARRPLPRRAYNCAHELGHHVCGHGSSIDELREDAKEHPWEDPKEFLADTFAGFALMPIMGLRRAFATRGWTPETATAAQMFTIACDFGVGYGTLLMHLSAGVNMISRSRAAVLQRVTPKALRADVLGALTPEPLIVADRHRVGPTLDAEVKTLLVLPPGAKTTGSGLVYERDLASGRMFSAVRPGIVQASADSGAWAVFVRIAPEAYVGLAQYRHLEDDRMSKSSSHADEPTVINETDLSRAWASVFLRIIDGCGTEVSPLVLSVSGFDDEGRLPEKAPVRQTLDQVLKQKRKISVEDVAFTIFPERLWQIARHDRARLFELYRGVYPRYVAMNRRANGRGLYFQRMTMFGANVPCKGNQLEWILSQYSSRSGIRDSMFHAAVFDPARDHIANARVGFPCLQHVSFVPTGDGLVVNAFYATQYIFDKAYGNYLGLAQLGAFMAREMGLRLARLNVTVGVAKLAGVSKSDAVMTPLIAAARAALSSPATVPARPAVVLAVAGAAS